MSRNFFDNKWEEIKPMCVAEGSSKEAEAHAKNIFLMGAALTITSIADRTGPSQNKTAEENLTLANNYIKNLGEQASTALKETLAEVSKEENKEG